MQNLETATLAGGCFWCTEAIFKRIKGVTSVTSGYSGGDPPAGGNNPTYEQVCEGNTEHAEAIQVTFDLKVISYEKLLEVFFALHDPTTLNRQGSDVGTQYRSAIFYHNENQRKSAEAVKSKLDKSSKYQNPIVTEIVPYKNFFKAENYHQNYYDSNKNQSYCQLVIDPKITKLYEEFKDIAN